MVVLIIQGNPLSVNQTYAKGRGRKLFLTDRAKSYGDSVGWQARTQYKKKPLECDLEVWFKYYFGSKRIHDHLNFSKVLCDRLNQILWVDDRQIKVSHHYTKFDKNNPRIEMIVKPLKEEEKTSP